MASRQPSSLAGKYLTFALYQESYGIDVLKVREIIRLTTITTVPQMPAHVRGVINLRGKISAEESAAAAGELNAQAEAMKVMVAELLKLVGGKVQATAESTVPAFIHSRKTHTTGPAAAGNGGSQTGSLKPAKRTLRPDTAAVATGNHRKNEIPLEGDFKDF